MKKEEAKQKAIEETTKALQKYIDENTVEKESDEESDEDFDDDSDDDSHYGNSNNGPDTYEKKNLEKFFELLKCNWTCDAGFYDSGKKIVCCYCPCSKHNKKWQEKYSVPILPHEKCEASPFKTPNALMDHLETKGTDDACILHKGIRIYFKALYGDYWMKLFHFYYS